MMKPIELSPVIEKLVQHPLPAQECEEPLLDIMGKNPRISYEASYFKQGIPNSLQRCYLRKTVFEMLQRALDFLPDTSYTFLVFDAFRPFEVQKALFDDYYRNLQDQFTGMSKVELEKKTKQFVSLPTHSKEFPAVHATGGAVDLTILRNGAPLDMGTEFDDFTPRACTDYFERDPCADELPRENRRILFWAMKKAGFENYSAEWWHYDFGDAFWSLRTGKPPIYGPAQV